jgi:O-antigen/teichoic acid export membrane protein
MGKLKLSAFKNKFFLVLFNNGFISIVGILTSSLLFHVLSVDEAGIWFFVQMFVAFCEAARWGFLSTATVTFYAGAEPKRAATVLGSVWFLALVLTAIILSLNAGAYFLIHTDDLETRLCIQWVGITFLSSLPADVIFWRLQANQKYNAMLWYRLLNSLSTIIAFIVLILLHKFTLENALLYNFLTNCLSSVVGIFLNMAGLKTLMNRSKECIMELVHYGKYTLGTTSFSVMLSNADTLIINFVLGTSAVAIYNLASKLLPLVELPLRSFITIGMSEMATSFNHKNMHQVTYIFKKYSGMLTLAFIPLIIAALFFSDIAINLFGGAKYHNSIAPNLFRAFMLVAILFPIDRFNGVALDIIHRTKTNFYKVVIMLVVKVAANFAGIAIFGNLYGIALSLFLVTLAAIIYGNYQLSKYLDYTIPGILISGFNEMKVFLQKNLRISSSK